MTTFKHLFTELEIGNTTLKNRILTTAHQTNHVIDGIPTEDFYAYHLTRAKGGLGLAIIEAAAVHPSGLLTTKTIKAYDERIVDSYKQLVETVHPHGMRVFAQLFHGGREVVSSDYRNAALAPSAVPSLRYNTIPRPMTVKEIKEVIEGFAISAQLAKEGGLDGIEVCCSHGYLPSQFWSEHTNLRTDEYGGSFENRMRFVVEIIERIWERVGEDFTVGIRMSSDEKTMDGTTIKDAVQIVEYLAEKVRLDFINVTAGDSSTFAGSTHIAPPSPMKHAYLTADAFNIRMAGAIPVFISNRVIDPVEAENIVATGKADAVAMTRATIVDPYMPNKAKNGELHTIDACLGCLQACIGHYHKGLPIGCIQNPETGRERITNALYDEETSRKRVLVIGAGPGGMQAAITADKKGHEVTLVDKSDRIGGLLNIMRKAPMRHELAESMIDNYSRQLERSNVRIELNKEMTKDNISEMNPDVVICALGSTVYEPNVHGVDDENVIYIDDLFDIKSFEANEKVVVFDFGGEWPGVEGAIYLAEKGCDVTFVTSRLHAAENVHQYLRNEYIKKLNQLHVNVVPQHDFGGIEDGQVILRNLFTHKETQEDYSKVVLAVGRVPIRSLYEELESSNYELHQIGDCSAPRTIEEATYEGMMASLTI